MPRVRLVSRLRCEPPTVSVAMYSPIGFREFSENDYRKFIRTLSDEELIKAGKRLRILCGDLVHRRPARSIDS